jgi:hypothetical protein
MSPMRMLATGGATALGLALLAYTSAMPLPYHRDDMARLRLSWSARPERIEVCRRLSAEEQERLAEHMRQRVVCEGSFATYTLRVDVGGAAVAEDVIRGAGLRNDRPMYLLREYSVPAGRHRIRVTLTRRETPQDAVPAPAQAPVAGADTGLFAGRAEREDTERGRRSRAAIPRSLMLDTTLAIAPREVVLVTFNAERRILEVRAEPPRR